MNASRTNPEAGFTLIELMVVIAIVGLLAAIGITSFGYYKDAASYSNAETTYRNARIAIEASMNDVDNPPVDVALATYDAAGAVGGAAGSLLLGFQLPRNTEFQVSYDSSCDNAACISEFIQVNHCLGTEHLQWIRFGDGADVMLERLPGGC